MKQSVRPFVDFERHFLYKNIMFRKFIINVHAHSCKDENPKDDFSFNSRLFCELNVERILLQIETDFYLVLMPKCIIDDKYDNIMELLKKAISGRKLTSGFQYYYGQIRKSITDLELCNFRLRGVELKKWVTQVHYSYSDNSGKPYYITSNMKFVEKWLGTWNEDLEASYNEAKIELKDHSYLLKQLDYLYECNIINDCYSETEMFKTIDELGKKIRRRNKQLTIKNQ